jgi:hypothetical protein
MVPFVQKCRWPDYGGFSRDGGPGLSSLIKGSRVQGFEGSRVQEEKRVQGFKGSRVQEEKGSRRKGFNDSRVQGFKGSRVQEEKGSRGQEEKITRKLIVEDIKYVEII